MTTKIDENINILQNEKMVLHQQIDKLHMALKKIRKSK
jgi:hypothetical protein